MVMLVAGFVASPAYAQLIIERTVAVNQTITDRTQYVSTLVWENAGLSSISRVSVELSFTNAIAARPMILGQFYGSLTHGTSVDTLRATALFSGLSGMNPAYTVESALNGVWLPDNTWSLLVADQVKGGGSAVWNSWKLAVEGAAAESGTFRPGTNGRISVSAGESTAHVGAAMELESGTSVAAEAGAGKILRLEGGLTGAGDLETSTAAGGKVVVGGNSENFTGVVKVGGSGTTQLDSVTALGRGTLRQTNGNSVVRLNFTGTLSNAIDVYKVAFATNGATLAGTVTVNNAEFDVADGNTNTVTGQITGTGGVTKTGPGMLVLAGTTPNDFTGSSAVNAGTLHLNKPAGTTAISGSTIAVNSGGTLLLGAANQIGDGTEVVLAGGTLDTSGFGDNVGILRITASSSIRGMNANGGANFLFSDIDLDTYGGSGGAILTFLGSYGFGSVINLSTQDFSQHANFNNFQSKIQFGNPGLFGQLNFKSATGFMTLTAIPEPKVYVAAAILAVMIGCAECRRRTQPGRGAGKKREGTEGMGSDPNM